MFINLPCFPALCPKSSASARSKAASFSIDGVGYAGITDTQGTCKPWAFQQSKQHRKLHELAQGNRDSVFYVLPFYAAHRKLEGDLPQLLTDTWFLPVEPMAHADVFGNQQSKVIRYRPGVASANPEYRLLSDFISEDLIADERIDVGITPSKFANWYSKLHFFDDEVQQARKHKNPWLIRSLRVAIAENVAAGS